MNILDIPPEIILHLSNYLNDQDQLSLFVTCCKLYPYQYDVLWTSLYSFDKISHVLNTYRFTRVTKLPSTKYITKYMTEINFSDTFNDDIIGVLPKKLSHLVFGRDFNQNIIGCLPDNLESVTFGDCFNKPIKTYQLKDKQGEIVTAIPNNIKTIIFGRDFNQDISECIPESVEYLKLPVTYEGDLTAVFPKCIKKLEIPGKCIDEFVIPNNVIELTIFRPINIKRLSYIPITVNNIYFVP